MPLSGTLDTMPLTDLLQWLHSSDADGTLTVSLDMEDTFIVFKKGDVAGLGSDDPLRWDVGQLLLARNLLDEETLRSAVRATKEGEDLEETLARKKIIPSDEIEEAALDHGYKTILDMFFDEEGSFYFSTVSGSQGLLAESICPHVRFFREPISSQTILMEGVKRMDEWGQIQEIFPSPYVVVHGMRSSNDNKIAKKLVEIGEPISLIELCLSLPGLSRFNIYRQLYKGYQQGLIGLDPATAGPGRTFSMGPTSSLLENAKVLLKHHQFDEARAVLSTTINLDPGNTEARHLLRELRASQLEHLYKKIPPHKVPKLLVERTQLASYGLTSQERYLASRLDGKWDVATLVVITPLGELKTLRALGKFLHAGIVGFE